VERQLWQLRWIEHLPPLSLDPGQGPVLRVFDAPAQRIRQISSARMHTELLVVRLGIAAAAANAMLRHGLNRRSQGPRGGSEAPKRQVSCTSSLPRGEAVAAGWSAALLMMALARTARCCDWACEPSVEDTAVPKYRLCGARISRGDNYTLLVSGLVAFVLGVLAIVTNINHASDGVKRRGSHSNNSGFGQQPYVLEQEAGLFGEAGGPCSKIAPVKSVVRACFLLVVQNERKILCYPLSFEKFVVPKYKLASVNFRKGGSTATMILGHALVTLGGILGVIAWSVGDSLDSCGMLTLDSCGMLTRHAYCGMLTPSWSPCLHCGLLTPLAIAAVVAGVVVVIATLFYSVYSVDLIMQKKPAPKGYVAFAARAISSLFTGSSTTVTLTPGVPPQFHLATHGLAKEPDRDFVMSYVYGKLGPNMGGHHTLTHLIKDNLPSRAPAYR